MKIKLRDAQVGDILRDSKDESFLIILLVNSLVVLRSTRHSTLAELKEGLEDGRSSVLCTLTSSSTEYELIERDGVPYVEKKWKPSEDEMYYCPCPESNELYNQTSFMSSSLGDLYRLKNGLCYPYTKQGKEDAIAHAKRMLEVK